MKRLVSPKRFQNVGIRPKQSFLIAPAVVHHGKLSQIPTGVHSSGTKNKYNNQMNMLI